MNEFLKRAAELSDEIVKCRRLLHENAETGCNLPKTAKIVRETLRSFGCEPIEMCGSATVCNIGKSGGKTILLRADCDALPFEEQSGETFACKTGASHSCGHDIHTAALLYCAKLLKEREAELKGNVKLVFQPDEERVLGAKELIKAGVLCNPRVDAAVAMHTNLPLKAGQINVLPGTYLSSSDLFRITVNGKSAHSSSPETGADPIFASAKIIDAVQAVSTRMTDAFCTNIITFGLIRAGETPNVIPENAILEGTVRCFDRDTRLRLLDKFENVVKRTAEVYGCIADVSYLSSTPTTYNDPEMTEECIGYFREMSGEDMVSMTNLHVKGSDDFAYFTEEVPGFMYHVGMGLASDGYTYSLHNPHVRFDERALPYSAAAYASVALRWLENHA